MNQERVIYTIGHSTHPIADFHALLLKYKIDTLIDVRSTPASSYSPQFNKDSLEASLSRIHIRYMHFGVEFGARQTDESLLDAKGIVDFELVQKTYNFQSGLERIDIGESKGYRIALMCAEADPLECHRFSMVSPPIEEIGIHVIHILKDGDSVTHTELEKQLLKKYEKKLPVPSLFEPDITEKDKLRFAYKLHNKDIGWRLENFDNHFIQYD